jgi:hypothetical protein
MADVFEPTLPFEEGSVSLQTWLPGAPYYDEVVRRNNVPGVMWALVTLTDTEEVDDQGAIPISI